MTEFSIYQINVDRDTANVCFIGMESLEKIKGTKEVNAAAYDRVYDGKMDCISLENIYQKFNVDHPADYKGRSLSVSDVVEIRESDTAFTSWTVSGSSRFLSTNRSARSR